jgi:hypothetical protein
MLRRKVVFGHGLVQAIEPGGGQQLGVQDLAGSALDCPLAVWRRTPVTPIQPSSSCRSRSSVFMAETSFKISRTLLKLPMSSLTSVPLAQKTSVIDIDLRSYFDNVRHDRQLAKVARRVDDADVTRLLKIMLKAVSAAFHKAE